VKQALPLFDAELKLAANPGERARILLQKGRALEDVGREPDAAADCYRLAVELEPAPRYLRALEQVEAQRERWKELERVRQAEADASADDRRLRAALLCDRARLLENRLGKPAEAIDVYEQAYALDPRADGALEALERLLDSQRRWQDLAKVLERRAEAATTPGDKALAWIRVAHVCAERLDSSQEAVRALARALASLPERGDDGPSATERLVLQSLSRAYESVGARENLASVLAREVEQLERPEERLAMMVRVGAIHEQLGRAADARAWYEAALRIDPAFSPAATALDALYAAAKAWEAVIVMNMGLSEASRDSRRRAQAHARIAEVFDGAAISQLW